MTYIPKRHVFVALVFLHLIEQGGTAMIFAMSDLHGCYDKYKKMLDKINFTEEDTLYILGDIVDRGEGGIDILLDILPRKNVVPLRGNHDYMACCLLGELLKSGKSYKNDAFDDTFKLWLSDGGLPTCEKFGDLPLDKQKTVLSFIKTFSIYEEITVGDNAFFMAHTVPEKERMDNFDTVMWQEFIVGEPEYEKVYSPDKYVVTGHTPTAFIDPEYDGKIFIKNNHIALDCGAVFDKPLGCICLDTFEEFYV